MLRSAAFAWAGALALSRATFPVLNTAGFVVDEDMLGPYASIGARLWPLHRRSL